MKKPESGPTRKLKRIRLFGIALALAGFGLMVYGGWSLFGIYSRERDMILLETGLSPEKGAFLVNCVTGASLMLIGIAMGLKAGETSGRNKQRK